MGIKKYIKDNPAIIALWIMLFFVIWIQVVAQSNSILESTLFSLLLILLCFPFTRYLSETLLQKAVKNKRLSTFTFQFIIFSIINGSFFTTLLYLFHYLENIGIFPYSSYFSMELPTMVLLVTISAGVVINAVICGIVFFQENAKLKRVLVEYQLRTLQHQITPHFMFNVLNHIHILMQTDVELASDLLIKYSDILRYQLYNGDKQTVTLEQDIQFLKDFIAVEEIRWQGKLTVSCSWRIENPRKEIPALLFITFVENAFKYVSKSDFEKGYIKIDIEEKNETISFSLENSKSTLTSAKAKDGGLGLRNIKERLEILYFGKHNLLIEESDTTYITKLVINT